MILILSILFFAGCAATTSSTLKYAENNFQAKSIDELVMTIGAPQSEYVMGNGDILYRWIYSGTINMPTTTIYNGSATASSYGNSATAYGNGISTTFGGGISNRVCDMSVLATHNNIIKKIKFNRDTLGTEPLTASMCAQMFGIN